MTHKKAKASAVRRLHRSFGAGASLFLMFMVLSGLIINHSNGLGLDQRHVTQPLLLGWYGLGGPENINSFKADDHWLSFAGSQLYLDATPISTVSNGIGAVSMGGMIIAAGSDELLLLDGAGTLIERLPANAIGGGPIESIGLLADQTVTVKSMGQLWLADAQLLSWRPSEDSTKTPVWSLPQATPETLHQTLSQQYRGEGVSVERLLLDFHSGRIFGPIGVLIYDLLALAVGFLAVSGLVFWSRGRRNGKRKN